MLGEAYRQNAGASLDRRVRQSLLAPRALPLAWQPRGRPQVALLAPSRAGAVSGVMAALPAGERGRRAHAAKPAKGANAPGVVYAHGYTRRS